MNLKTAKAIRKTLKAMGMDFRTHRGVYKHMKKMYKEGKKWFQ